MDDSVRCLLVHDADGLSVRAAGSFICLEAQRAAARKHATSSLALFSGTQSIPCQALG